MSDLVAVQSDLEDLQEGRSVSIGKSLAIIMFTASYNNIIITGLELSVPSPY